MLSLILQIYFFLIKGDQANINLTCFHKEKNGENAARRRSAADWSSSPVFKFMKEYISQRYTIHSATPEGCLFGEEEEDEEGCSLPPSALPFCFYYLEKARFHFHPRSNKFKFQQKSNLPPPEEVPLGSGCTCTCTLVNWSSGADEESR